MTISPGELPELAVVREVFEETGLCSFATVTPIGTADFDARPYGKEEQHRRHFFHLTVEGVVPERWLHYERAASEEQRSAIAFELFWLPFDEAARSLDFGQGALLTLVDSAT